MRLFLILIFSLFCAIPPLSAQGNGIEQASELITVGPDKFLRWYGHDERTYFIQVSDPNDHLKRWTWAPIIESGNNADISYEVDGTADKGFFRLKYTDQPTTDPDNDDFDGDSISNINEVSYYNSDPLDADSDNDGFEDNYESWYGTNPNNPDSDNDGLSDGDEYWIYGTYPNYADTDGDGLLDGIEVNQTNTSPTVADTDGDGMKDGFEVTYMLNPLLASDAASDADSDGLSNLWEYKLKLNPRLTDSNSNGISDALEDRELDGLANLAELTTHSTDPSQPDTDMDTLPDGWELANGFDPTVHNGTDGNAANNATADPDGDGLNNSQEADNNTKANDPDSDGDGVDDGVEVGQGSNPNDPNDSQPPPNGTVPVNVTFGDPSGSNSEKYQVKLTPLEGDTSGNGVRFRTNRDYGVPQTDTFQLPKGAKYKVTLEWIATDPDYDGDPSPDYDYQLEFDLDANCLVVDDPDGIITDFNGDSEEFFAEGKDATLYVPLFKPMEVSFSNSTIGSLTNDDVSITYDAPHWQDGNDDGVAQMPGERNYPIAYVRNTPPTIAGKIKVKPSGLTSVSGFSAKIKVTGPGNIKIDETAATIGTDEIELPAAASTGNFVNEIDYLNPMTLSWEVEVSDKDHWCESGETANRAYVTLGTPATSMRQETLFDIGCRNADGETVAADATAKIWSEFTDRVVKKVDPDTGQPIGTQMTYYASYNPLDFNGQSVVTAPQLLEANDGQCGSWADLLIRVRQAQSIDDPDEYVIFGSPNTGVGFAVKNWSFAQNGTSSNATYPYLNICPLGNGSLNANFSAVRGANSYNWAYAEVTDSSGIEGQGTTNPASLFGNHQVMISGQFYDPSYGILHAALADIDTNAVDGYFILSTENLNEATYGLDLNSDGDQTDVAVPTACYLFRKNPAGNNLVIQFQINR